MSEKQDARIDIIKNSGERKERGKKFKKRPVASKPLEETWNPITKLGRLVKEGHIKGIEEIFSNSLPIKEPEIVDYLFGKRIKDVTLKIKSVQKQTQAGQRTRFQAIVAIGDHQGHISLGIKVSKEVANAIRGALVKAKISIVPVKLGYWGNAIGEPHTVPCKVTGKCGSVVVRLIPAPRGAGIVAGPVTKKMLELAGVEDCFTNSKGNTSTVYNVAMATYIALKNTYVFLTPDMWKKSEIPKNIFQKHTQVFDDK